MHRISPGIYTSFPQVIHKMWKTFVHCEKRRFFGIFHVFCTSNVENLKRRGKDKKMIDSPAAIFL